MEKISGDSHIDALPAKYTPDELKAMNEVEIAKLNAQLSQAAEKPKPESKFKRVKTLVYKKRFAPKNHAFFIVEYKAKHKTYKLSLLLDCTGKTDQTEELLFMKMEAEMEAELKKAGVI